VPKVNGFDFDSLTRHDRGFTIVELLIVIVVIAVLAAITAVAYNGLQVRARNMARLQAADGIFKQLEPYTHQTGKGFGANVACLPTEANYDAGNGGLPDCVASDAPWSENAQMNSTLSTAGYSKFSYPASPVVSESGVAWRGIAVSVFANTSQGMNGKLRPYILYFFLEGSDQDCGPNSVTFDSAKVSSDPLNSIVPARNYRYDAKMTRCAWSLTHPSSV
jgi:prepilin-type N-terminal cleavage/methylation domain-containing protein